MSEETSLTPRQRWLRDFGGHLAWVLLLGFVFFDATDTSTPWTPVIYRAGAENEPLRLSAVRTLSECQTAPFFYLRGVAEAGGDIAPYGDLCMRRCWFLEDKIRPNAVRTIAGVCQVVVNGSSPRASQQENSAHP